MPIDAATPTVPLSETLKEATAEAHRRAESADLQRQLVRGALDEGRLVSYLAQLRAAHAELERRLDEDDDLARAIDWSDASRHSRRLDADLAALGATASATEPLPATRSLIAAIERALAAEPASLLGFVYVLEGSMNGNQFIARALHASPARARCPFDYFDPYGDEQRSRWAAFKRALDDVPLEASHRDDIVGAALHMFESIRAIAEEAMTAAPPPTIES